MTNEYSVDEMLSFYEETMRELTKTVTATSKAKRLAKKELHKKYPMNVIFNSDHTSERGRLIGGMAKIIHKYYSEAGTPKIVKPDQYRFEAVDQKTEGLEKASFMDIMRSAGNTGFIPDFEFIAPFLAVAYDKKNEDMRTKKNVEQYISLLRRDGFTVERNGKGWTVVPPKPKETEEQKRQRIFNEKLAEIQKRHEADIEELKKQFLSK